MWLKLGCKVQPEGAYKNELLIETFSHLDSTMGDNQGKFVICSFLNQVFMSDFWPQLCLLCSPHPTTKSEVMNPEISQILHIVFDKKTISNSWTRF